MAVGQHESPRLGLVSDTGERIVHRSPIIVECIEGFSGFNADSIFLQADNLHYARGTKGKVIHVRTRYSRSNHAASLQHQTTFTQRYFEHLIDASIHVCVVCCVRRFCAWAHYRPSSRMLLIHGSGQNLPWIPLKCDGDASFDGKYSVREGLISNIAGKIRIMTSY